MPGFYTSFFKTGEFYVPCEIHFIPAKILDLQTGRLIRTSKWPELRHWKEIHGMMKQLATTAAKFHKDLSDSWNTAETNIINGDLTAIGAQFHFSRSRHRSAFDDSENQTLWSEDEDEEGGRTSSYVMCRVSVRACALNRDSSGSSETDSETKISQALGAKCEGLRTNTVTFTTPHTEYAASSTVGCASSSLYVNDMPELLDIDLLNDNLPNVTLDDFAVNADTSSDININEDELWNIQKGKYYEEKDDDGEDPSSTIIGYTLDGSGGSEEEELPDIPDNDFMPPVTFSPTKYICENDKPKKAKKRTSSGCGKHKPTKKSRTSKSSLSTPKSPRKKSQSSSNGPSFGVTEKPNASFPDAIRKNSPHSRKNKRRESSKNSSSKTMASPRTAKKRIDFRSIHSRNGISQTLQSSNSTFSLATSDQTLAAAGESNAQEASRSKDNINFPSKSTSNVKRTTRSTTVYKSSATQPVTTDGLSNILSLESSTSKSNLIWDTTAMEESQITTKTAAERKEYIDANEREQANRKNLSSNIEIISTVPPQNVETAVSTEDDSVAIILEKVKPVRQRELKRLRIKKEQQENPGAFTPLSTKSGEKTTTSLNVQNCLAVEPDPEMPVLRRVTADDGYFSSPPVDTSTPPSLQLCTEEIFDTTAGPETLQGTCHTDVVTSRGRVVKRNRRYSHDGLGISRLKASESQTKDKSTDRSLVDETEQTETMNQIERNEQSVTFLKDQALSTICQSVEVLDSSILSGPHATQNSSTNDTSIENHQSDSTHRQSARQAKRNQELENSPNQLLSESLTFTEARTSIPSDNHNNSVNEKRTSGRKYEKVALPTTLAKQAVVPNTVPETSHIAPKTSLGQTESIKHSFPSLERTKKSAWDTVTRSSNAPSNKRHERSKTRRSLRKEKDQLPEQHSNPKVPLSSQEPNGKKMKKGPEVAENSRVENVIPTLEADSNLLPTRTPVPTEKKRKKRREKRRGGSRNASPDVCNSVPCSVKRQKFPDSQLSPAKSPSKYNHSSDTSAFFKLAKISEDRASDLNAQTSANSLPTPDTIRLQGRIMSGGESIENEQPPKVYGKLEDTGLGAIIFAYGDIELLSPSHVDQDLNEQAENQNQSDYIEDEEDETHPILTPLSSSSSDEEGDIDIFDFEIAQQAIMKFEVKSEPQSAAEDHYFDHHFDNADNFFEDDNLHESSDFPNVSEGEAYPLSFSQSPQSVGLENSADSYERALVPYQPPAATEPVVNIAWVMPPPTMIPPRSPKKSRTLQDNLNKKIKQHTGGAQGKYKEKSALAAAGFKCSPSKLDTVELLKNENMLRFGLGLINGMATMTANDEEIRRQIAYDEAPMVAGTSRGCRNSRTQGQLCLYDSAKSAKSKKQIAKKEKINGMDESSQSTEADGITDYGASMGLIELVGRVNFNALDTYQPQGDEFDMSQRSECMAYVIPGYAEGSRKYKIWTAQAEKLTFDEIKTQFQTKIKYPIREILEGKRENRRFSLFKTGNQFDRKIMKNMPMLGPFTQVQGAWFHDLVAAEYDDIIERCSNPQLGLNPSDLINHVLIPELATRLFASITNTSYDYAASIMVNRAVALTKSVEDEMVDGPEDRMLELEWHNST